MNLRLDFCSFEAAKYAVEHWHYSRSMPAGKRVHIGVWEDDDFIGVIIYSLSANQHLGKAFGLTMFQVCELVRVALTKHQTPVSRMLAISIRVIQKHFPGQRLMVSYADTDQGHHGGIYAASGWIYMGIVELGMKGTPTFRIHGKKTHGRTVYQHGWKQEINWIKAHVDPLAELIYPKGKHKYLYPLDEKMREQILPLSKPYPKRCATSETGDTPPIQGGKGGSTPTVALSEPQTNLS
jgi:hypothetical protein